MELHAATGDRRGWAKATTASAVLG
jgi:hypothetical protein